MIVLPSLRALGRSYKTDVDDMYNQVFESWAQGMADSAAPLFCFPFPA